MKVHFKRSPITYGSKRGKFPGKTFVRSSSGTSSTSLIEINNIDTIVDDLANDGQIGDRNLGIRSKLVSKELRPEISRKVTDNSKVLLESSKEYSVENNDKTRSNNTKSEVSNVNLEDKSLEHDLKISSTIIKSEVCNLKSIISTLPRKRKKDLKVSFAEDVIDNSGVSKKLKASPTKKVRSSVESQVWDLLGDIDNNKNSSKHTLRVKIDTSFDQVITMLDEDSYESETSTDVDEDDTESLMPQCVLSLYKNNKFETAEDSDTGTEDIPSSPTFITYSSLSSNRVSSEDVFLKKQFSKQLNDNRFHTSKKIIEDLKCIFDEITESSNTKIIRSALLNLCGVFLKGNSQEIIFNLSTLGISSNFYRTLYSENDPIILFCFGFIINEYVTMVGINSLLQSRKEFYCFKKMIQKLLKGSNKSIYQEIIRSSKIPKLSKSVFIDVLFSIIKNRFEDSINHIESENLNSKFYGLSILRIINNRIEIDFEDGSEKDLLYSLYFDDEISRGINTSIKQLENYNDYLEIEKFKISSFKMNEYALVIDTLLSSLNFNISFQTLLPIDDNNENFNVNSSDSFSYIFNNVKNSIDDFIKQLNIFSQLIPIFNFLLEENTAFVADYSTKEKESLCLIIYCCQSLMKIFITLSSNYERLLDNGINNDKLVESIFSPTLTNNSLSLAFSLSKFKDEKLQLLSTGLKFYCLGYLVNCLENPQCKTMLLTNTNIIILKKLIEENEEIQVVENEQLKHTMGYSCLIVGSLIQGNQKKFEFSKNDNDKLIINLKQFKESIERYDVGFNGIMNQIEDTIEYLKKYC